MSPEDPVSAGAGPAIAHLNADHADALLEMAQALGGAPEASAARCTGADGTGLDLVATTAAGEVPMRVTYLAPISDPGELRKATVELARAARESLSQRSSHVPPGGINDELD